MYLLLRRVVWLIAGSSNNQMNAEVEVVVLRHQLMVLQRRVGGPRLRRRDRLFMAAISRAFPRARWSSFVVSLVPPRGGLRRSAAAASTDEYEFRGFRLGQWTVDSPCRFRLWSLGGRGGAARCS
jgi:hypothetical protein